MSTLNQPIAAGFTPGERDYIRRELDMFFSTYPTVAEGFMIKTWRGGVDAGKPKLSPVAKGLIDRGLMRLDTGSRAPRLFFTTEGLAELRAMMTDRRFADPRKLQHIREELGIDPALESYALTNANNLAAELITAQLCARSRSVPEPGRPFSLVVPVLELARRRTN
jgi:hypothetical protein